MKDQSEEKFLRAKVDLLQCLKEEREESDRLYAIKLVERVVWGLVGMICIAAIAALLKLIIE